MITCNSLYNDVKVTVGQLQGWAKTGEMWSSLWFVACMIREL